MLCKYRMCFWFNAAEGCPFNWHCLFPNHSLYRRYGLYKATDNSRMEESACLVKKSIGKTCTGEPYARFDVGG